MTVCYPTFFYADMRVKFVCKLEENSNQNEW